jgi:hypothetical protein
VDGGDRRRGVARRARVTTWYARQAGRLISPGTERALAVARTVRALAAAEDLVMLRLRQIPRHIQLLIVEGHGSVPYAVAVPIGAARIAFSEVVRSQLEPVDVQHRQALTARWLHYLGHTRDGIDQERANLGNVSARERDG